MSGMIKVSVRFSQEQISALKGKARDVCMTESELIRLSVVSFLAKENALTEYLEGLEILDKKLAVIATRQEQFARAVGFAALSAEVEKNAATRAGFADRIGKIVETIS